MLKLAERALIILCILSGALLIDALLFHSDSKPTKLNSIVRMNQGIHTFCTATVINQNTAVTAAHCILEQDMMGNIGVLPLVEIRPDTNQPVGVYATVIYVTTQLDTAMLRGDFSKFQFKPYTQTINKLMDLQHPGVKFKSCGYPLGGTLQCTETIFKERVNFSIRVTGLLLPGMSGGPTMTEDGTVVAINNAVDGTDSIVTPIYNIDFNMGSK